MKNIIITNVLDYKHGGRTKSLIQRANMLAATGKRVEILFTGLDETLETKFKYFKEHAIINPEIKLTSMWTLFRQHPHPVGYNFDNREDKQTFDYKTVLTDDDVLKEVIYKYKNNPKRTIYTDVLDDEGYLFKRKHYVFNKLVKSTFYNKAEEIILEFKYYNHNTEVTTADMRVMSYNDYKSEFFKSYIADEQINIIVDARKEDDNVTACNFQHNQVFFVFHSSHTNLKGVCHKGYKKIIMQSKENYHIIALTNEQKEDMSNLQCYGGIKIDVIGHPITITSHNSEYDKDRYIIISRIDESKQVLDCVKAFALFIEKNPHKNLNIYGHGKELEMISQYIKDHNLENNIFMHGYTNAPLNEYQKSYASLTTTQFEGFGMSIAESISVGCPVLSYRFKYGQKDLIKEGQNGYICEENTYQSLAELLAATKDLDLDRKQIANTMKPYEQSAITQKWIDVLNI